MSEAVSKEVLEKAKLNQETSQIAWSELQRYFAQGVVLRVDDSLDLIDVGYQISIDHKHAVEVWVEQGGVSAVSDELAQLWFEENRELWAVVVRPWVLVQERMQEKREIKV